MSDTPHTSAATPETVRRIAERRRSNAAGPHRSARDRGTRTARRRAAIADQLD